MPIEIRPFGVGHRRPDELQGTVGLASQVIHSDGRGAISEVALARNARIEPRSNPNTAYFVVIEGGGWVGVGEERARIAAGEAAIWPADVIHSAWTEHSEMRAFVVEFAGADDGGSVFGRASDLAPGGDEPVARGTGQLTARIPTRPGSQGPRDGEPA